MTETSPRVVVVGGGLSGLTAAYQLSLELPDAHVTVLEASASPGGALHTVDFPSGPMELGAEAFIARRPEASQLVVELGLTDSLRHPGPLGPAILTGGRAVPMPRGTLMGLPSDVDALSEVLGPAEREVAAREADLPLAWEPGSDVSLGALIAERFGPAVVARLVDPMLGGVYAAPSSGLGLRQVVPGLAEALDRGAPSLTAAARQLTGTRTPGPVFATLDGGYRVLVDALAAASGALIRTGARCTSLRREGNGYTLAVARARR
ncbi:FAD-dependent oxidoreductase, partial [Dietzia cinnamea]|uniref:FAD-dependent oxidoreductase n=1 Tax=Dietzia cinnamea TaxID=321318 RepID=UPI0021A8C694